ncbi:MAG: cytidine deaminase [Bacilli bacterium]
MKEELKELLYYSRSKYFSFPVSSIIVCTNGEKFSGVNVETASPAAGCCAERVALYAALSHGKTIDDFSEIHIMNNTESYVYPCFICRQALMEYCPPSLKVITYSKDFKSDTVYLKDLCPYPFAQKDLK